MKTSTFHGLFWGLALIILGLGLFARFYYNIHFPWFRIFIAFVFIYAGLWLILHPRFDLSSGNLVLFSQGRLQYDENQKDYAIIFGSGMFDIDNITLIKTHAIEVNGIFSESIIRIGNQVNCKIQGGAAFANFSGPGGNTVSFGNQLFQPPWFDPGKPYLIIKANVVFGSMRAVIAD